MSSILLDAVKEMANNLIQNNKLCDWLVGEVTADSPLEVTIDNSLVLTDDVLYLTKNVMEWSVDMSVDHHTENQGGGGGYAAFASHNHGYKGRKTYLVHNELKVGDQVYLLRASGGQKFIVIDRVFNPNRGCKD